MSGCLFNVQRSMSTTTIQQHKTPELTNESDFALVVRLKTGAVVRADIVGVVVNVDVGK